MSSVVCDVEIRSWDVQHGLSYLTVQVGRCIEISLSFSFNFSSMIWNSGNLVDLPDSNPLGFHQVWPYCFGARDTTPGNS